VTPINPRASEVNVRNKAYATVSSPSALQSPTETSLSIITPPKVTIGVLKEAKAAGIPAVWLQPGTFDDDVIEYVKKEFKAALYGMDGGTSGGEGWCVLVDGEDGLDLAGRKWERQRL
jgi:predicted CoA-binding protein